MLYKNISKFTKSNEELENTLLAVRIKVEDSKPQWNRRLYDLFIDFHFWYRACAKHVPSMCQSPLSYE